MKLILLIFCCALGLSASAQWYHIDLKKHIRYPLLEQAANHSSVKIASVAMSKPAIHAAELNRSEYSFEAAEDLVMKTAQHNMRYRVYNDASYNFSALARLYIQQNRYSEAKWYLLQSNAISREQNDDKHTIANLIDLAMIKASIGDYALALQDITEAHDIASAKGLKDDMAVVDKEMLFIKQNKSTAPKTDLRYAETPQGNSKSE
jgi:hypothetical protein